MPPDRGDEGRYWPCIQRAAAGWRGSRIQVARVRSESCAGGYLLPQFLAISIILCSSLRLLGLAR
jgi:hypothetical protein